MPATRRALPLLMVATAVVIASCGTPGGQAGSATPGAPTSVDGGGWFSYSPATGTSPAATAPKGPVTPAATAAARAMDTDRFWQLVDRAASPDPVSAAESLRTALSALPPDEALAFEAEFVHQMGRSNTMVHLAAAETIMGATSEDVFVSFRTWVLAQGRAVYDAFVTDPDSLAAHGPDDDEQIGATEAFEGVALEVWSAQTGRDPFAADSEVPTGDSLYDDPTGTRLSDTERITRFPRLTAAYVGGDPSAGPAPVQRR